MTGLISECKRLFHCTNLYEVLGVKKECKSVELRKAFYKMSLVHHPDRQSEATKAEATVRFQILSKIYALLADEEKRQIYDETGVIDEEGALDDKTYDDWVKYWQLLFPKVTAQQIDEFCVKYRDSPEELNDLAEIYERCKGDMDVIMETHLFASHADEDRIRDLVNKLIKDGRVKVYEDFINENPEKASKRAKRAEKEVNLFEREQKKKARKTKSTNDENGMESLTSAILANRDRHLKATENLLDRLTEKYCKPTESKAKTKRSKK